MAQRVRCLCGKEYRVSFRHVGLPLKCKLCGRPLLLGDAFHDQEAEDFREGRRGRDDAGEPDEADAEGRDAERCCEACLQFAPGRVYHFYAGKQQYNYQNRRLQMNLAKYTNVGKYHAYLCDRCVAATWRFRCVWRLLVGLAPGAALLPMALCVVVAVQPYVGLVCLLLSSMLAGLCALYSAYNGWRLATGVQTREDRERVAIRLMRPKYSRSCDCFWTTREYDELCRRFGEE